MKKPTKKRDAFVSIETGFPLREALHKQCKVTGKNLSKVTRMLWLSWLGANGIILDEKK
jgi:hypothetical protein